MNTDSYGQQRFPHKYVKRMKHDGRWVYVYATDKQKNLSDVIKDTKEHRVVIAHGKPLSVFVDDEGSIVHGPPQTVGKHLFVNTNPKKSYFAIARDTSTGTSVYMYTEDQLDSAIAKKAAKVAKARVALDAIDKHAERLMAEPEHEMKQLGLIMWLNNNSRLRIGAHEDAASVDPSERQKILNKARVENWSEKEKQEALNQARQQTFGLMTLRAGHIRLNPQNNSVSFVFRGKGGKMVTDQTVTVPLKQPQMQALNTLMSGRFLEDKVFPDVEYKKVWRIYKKFGVTPHISRSYFADSMVSEILKDFERRPSEGSREALRRLRDEIKTSVSDRLGHTMGMTMKAYVTKKTQNAYQALSDMDNKLKESDSVIDPNMYADLAEVITWTEIGPGNVVV